MYNPRIDVGRGVYVRDVTTRVALHLAEGSWRLGLKGFHTIERIEDEMRPSQFRGRIKILKNERIKSVFYFYQAYSQRSGKSAREILGNLLKWWEKNPDLFDPLKRPEETPEFVQFVREVDPQASAEDEFRELEWWKDVVRALRRYGGDARKFFYGMDETGSIPFYDAVMGTNMDSWEEVCVLRDRLIKQFELFSGVRVKVASMFMIFFQEGEWRDKAEFWERLRRIPFVPVDLHHIRLSWMFAITDVYEEENERVRDAHRDMVSTVLSHYFSRICFEEGLNHSYVAQAFYNTGAVIHARWNRAKSNAHKQHLICMDDCAFNGMCKHVVTPDQELTQKKKGKAQISRQIRYIKHVTTLEEGGEVTAAMLPQAPLFSDGLPTVEQAEEARAGISPDTKNRGALCRNIKKRDKPIYTTTLFGDPDKKVKEFLQELASRKELFRPYIEDLLAHFGGT